MIHYDLVESLDRLEIAEKLNHLASQAQKKIKVLVEVNSGREPQKSGILPEDVTQFVDALRQYPHIELKGFMTMPPPIEIESRRPFFRSLKGIYDQISQTYPLEVLSMGTSEDYCIALQEGANLIRLGTALFGSRQH
ncbi:MAG: YggS family pyridoxal phosphate-dependent enzyme [Proteobacteria bacterium]|nr:YggS family pyridoxal phosphate-dependent enzyme [Pseudomonadota bacterium]